jgi:hypothetical protein
VQQYLLLLSTTAQMLTCSQRKVFSKNEPDTRNY